MDELISNWTTERQIENPKSLWSESSTRLAGFRQTLKIGDAEYGFCWIPAGEFDMGASEFEDRGFRYEGHYRHGVKLTRGFWMLETPTTQTLYREVMGTNPSFFKGDDLPVEQVSWDDAMEFCKGLSKRLPRGVKATLPTESQWEYSCRAGTSAPYWFGGELNGDKANCNGNYPYGVKQKGAYLGKTTPVKSYPPNPWGLFDMHGNICEWQLDFFGFYPTSPVVDPTGAEFASIRVHRGGCWSVGARRCRSAIRGGDAPSTRNSCIGFRFLLICD